MKVSLNWLRRYVDIPWGIDELSHRLTMTGLEIDGVTEIAPAFTGVTVARVLDVRPHPDADRLRIATVDTGAEQTDVVCGASNCRGGLTIAYARVGARLAGGLKIKKAKIRGVVSLGMLCSEDELGLATERAPGILELAGDLALGANLEDALPIADTVLDIAVTANRGDCFSHFGVAREIAAITGGELRHPETELAALTTGEAVPVEIRDAERCARYVGRVVRGLGVAESPFWMRRLLSAVGVRPISNLVDVTNFVMMELGQPLHAFDLGDVRGGRVVVRVAEAGEKMATLDGTEREFTADDLLICDGEGPVAVAGVMGGLDSEIKDHTTDVLLESAWFHPSTVRLTSRRLGLKSESSHRFERFVDPGNTLNAANRALRLFCELSAPGTSPQVVETYTDNQARTVRRPEIRYVPGVATRLLGLEIPADTQIDALERLGFERVGDLDPGPGWVVRVPSWRGEVHEPADLVEEVARLHGFDAIPTPPPRLTAGAGTTPNRAREARLRRLRHFLTGRGLNQALNYSFLGTDALALFDQPAPLELLNPLSEDQRALRTVLAARLVHNAAHNVRHGHPDVGLFEVGKVFHAREVGTQPQETERLGLVLTGRAQAHFSGGRELDFFDLKGLVEDLVTTTGRTLTVEPTKVPWLHPGATARVFADGVEFGVCGLLHPRLQRAFDVTVAVAVAELDLEPLVGQATEVTRFVDFGRQPATSRDVALQIQDLTLSSQVLTAIGESGIDEIDSVEVFDVYRSESMAPGTYSLGLRIIYRADDRTLTDDEVNETHRRLVGQLESAFGATAR